MYLPIPKGMVPHRTEHRALIHTPVIRTSEKTGLSYIAIKCTIIEDNEHGGKVFIYAYRPHDHLRLHPRMPTSARDIDNFKPFKAMINIEIREYNEKLYNTVRSIKKGK